MHAPEVKLFFFKSSRGALSTVTGDFNAELVTLIIMSLMKIYSTSIIARRRSRVNFLKSVGLKC